MCCLCQALFAVFIGLMAVAFGVMYVLAGVPTARVLEGAALHASWCSALCMALAWRDGPRHRISPHSLKRASC